MPCVFCDEKFSEPRGIDRKDSRIGYTLENCQACCTFCNRFKSNLSQHTFLNHVRKISTHQDKTKLAERSVILEKGNE